MIFITVGTHTQPFNRLLIEVDRLVKEKLITEKVIAQIGSSTYTPKSYEYFRFTSYQKFCNLVNKSRIVITHGGAGSIILVSKLNKPIIAVPRLKVFREHISDHQLQLVKKLGKARKLLVVYDIKNLYRALQIARQSKIKNKSKKVRLIEILGNYLEKLQKQLMESSYKLQL